MPDETNDAAAGRGDSHAVRKPDHDGGWRTSYAVPVAIVAITIGLIGAIIIVARQEQDAGAAALGQTTVKGPLPVTVPYREVGGYVVVDVSFGDGSRTEPMILDTGGPTIVSEDIAAVFAGEPAGTIAGASAGGQVVTSEVVPIGRLALGEAVFHDVGAVVGAIDAGNPFHCLTDAGFIGASLMQAAAWQIDPVARSVTIAATADDLDISGATRLDFSASGDVSPSPLFELPAGEGSLAFVADTGSDGWLAVHPADLDGTGIELPQDIPTVSMLAPGTDGATATRAHWLTLEVGAEGDARRLPLAVAEGLAQGQGDAGTAFLWQHVLSLDWAGSGLYLDPIGDVAPPVPMSAELGWDEGYVVGAYVEGVEANDQLELGSPVAAIDGGSVQGVPFDDFCTRVVRGTSREPYTMTLAGEMPTTVEVAPVEDFFDP